MLSCGWENLSNLKRQCWWCQSYSGSTGSLGINNRKPPLQAVVVKFEKHGKITTSNEIALWAIICYYGNLRLSGTVLKTVFVS